MLNSMLFNKDFLTLLLIGWRLCCQPIRCHVWKLLLTNMDFNMEISSYPVVFHPVLSPEGLIKLNLLDVYPWCLFSLPLWSMYWLLRFKIIICNNVPLCILFFYTFFWGVGRGWVGVGGGWVGVGGGGNNTLLHFSDMPNFIWSVVM